MIAIIDVTGNNLCSLTNALHRLGYENILTHCPNKIKGASHVILPGVGAAFPAMQALRAHNLITVLKQITQPLLGICLGMQLLYESSEEGDIYNNNRTNVDCLALIPGVIQRLPHATSLPVPHMGWNNLQWSSRSPLQQGLSDNEYVYFVHSYAALNNDYAIARCQYSDEFTAIVQRNNIYGMQFHPEKSAKTGLTLLSNFLRTSLENIC